MFGICLLHVNGFSGATLNKLSSVLMSCVPAFIFISGFYGIRFSFSKVIRLWGVAAYCSLCAVAFAVILGGVNTHAFFHSFCVQLTQNWFLNEYTLLMLFAPILNYTTEVADARKLMLMVLPFLFAAWCWNYGGGCLSYYGVPSLPEFGGYKFLMMAVVYVLARLYRRFSVWRIISLRRGIVLLVVAVAGCMFKLHQYHSPFTILLAIVAFTCFYRITWPYRLKKFALFCAPSMFSIFILHSVVMLPILIPKSYAFVHAKLSVPVLIELFIVAGILYFGGLTVDLLLRRIPLCFLRKSLSSAMDVVDNVWNLVVSWSAGRALALGNK